MKDNDVLDFRKNDVVDFYERLYELDNQYKIVNLDKTMGIHIGYYEKNIRTIEDAVINMNYFVGKLLNLNILNETKKECRVLDAGCGVGGTSIHLAKKYPNIKFKGITISPFQVRLANKFAQDNNVTSNTKFLLRDYLKTEFPNDYFDGISAIESIGHASEKKDFLIEMYRILKTNKKLVIVGFFLIEKPSNYFCKIAYDFVRNTWKIPYMETIKIFKLDLEDTGFTDIERNKSKDNENILQANYRNNFKKVIKYLFPLIIFYFNIRYLIFTAKKR
jgi:cyclopropane fatty-acyl-phospholipid synthase-like methyltransferase